MDGADWEGEVSSGPVQICGLAGAAPSLGVDLRLGRSRALPEGGLAAWPEPRVPDVTSGPTRARADHSHGVDQKVRS